MRDCVVLAGLCSDTVRSGNEALYKGKLSSLEIAFNQAKQTGSPSWCLYDQYCRNFFALLHTLLLRVLLCCRDAGNDT